MVVLVNVNVAVPAETPVTTPLLVTVATAGLLLTQLPPLVGDKPVVEPTQMLVGPVIATTGNAFTVTGEVAAETQPVVVFVKVNVEVPAETAVTTPAFVTVATAGSLLTQVPPEVGESMVVAPTQMLLAPVMLTTGEPFTVTAEVTADWHPVVELVKIKVALPAETPVTTPALVTVATAGLLLIQVPPVVGDNVVVPPIQTLLGPVMLTAGVGLTVSGEVGTDIQPVVPSVKVNAAVPAETAVITPALSMVATAGLLLDQVPPLVGETPDIAPIQMLVRPV